MVCLNWIQVLTRKAKNQYTWKGFEAIPKALKELKVAIIFLFENFGCSLFENWSDFWVVMMLIG